MLPGLDVAVYEAVPLPSYADAVNETVAEALPATALTLVGALTNFPALEVLPLITRRSSRQSSTTRL